jgi:uncharacterized repeat protein (TIGR01451 family)
MPLIAVRRALRACLLVCLSFCLPSTVFAQCVSLTTLGSAATQNFDTLSNTAGSTTNNLTIPGWFMTETGGGTRDNEQYAVDTGASNTGDTFSYGAAGATDRALGGLRSGSLIPSFGACFTNNTGTTVTSLAVAYTGEEWRLGTAARTDQLTFEYSTNATDLSTGSWIAVTALNFVTPDTATAGAKNGNAASARTALSSTISSLSIANGATFWIRWTDVDASSADDGLAVDDFSLTPQGAVVRNLSINDVMLNEGNSGTTSFTFTVSLSAPAGAGGVTFNIATADGTAVAPGDYTARSLTAQTIPAGSSTYSFTVLVNGDTAPEANETFFVNVTGVTGATVTDSQGQGTIVNDDVAPNLTINDVSLNEGNAGTTTFAFTVSLSAPAPTGGVTFDIATANGTAVAPGDYTTSSLTAQTIPAGSSTYTFNVLVNGDTAPESNETFFVNVANVTNAIVTDGQGQGLIVNDDVAPNLTINDVSLDEGNSGATTFAFTVSLSAPAPTGGVTFDIATADGTAAAPGDYATKSLTAQTIPAGSSTYTFDVLVNGDTSPESNETFFVNVTNVTNAIVTDGQGQGTIVNEDVAPNLSINDVFLNEGDAGPTTFAFTVSLSAPAPTGGVTFDIATANGTAVAPGDYTASSLTGQTIPAGSSTYTFNVPVNGDATPEGDENFFVNVTNVADAVVTDGQGQGTIINDDLTRIHDVQGNGAASPIVGASVMVEGIVTGNYQGAGRLRGFFLQEEDADADADPATSEGVFVFCDNCPTPVAEGQRVNVIGPVSESDGQTRISAPGPGAITVMDAGNNLAQVTPTAIDLPVVGDIAGYYESRESMRVTYVDTLTVSDYFELARYGQVVLTEGGRPRAFAEFSAPSVAGYTAYLDAIARRQVLLDDDNNAQQSYLASTDGMQSIYHPRANGGFSVGTQGTDFFRGGDLVNGLTGVLDFASPGSGAATWRVRPTAATPVAFTVANPRPATPPAVGGAIKVAGANLLNYFTTIDTTASSSSGPCGPGGTLDCRGADSVAELNRQRERISIVACALNADVVAFMELENTTPSATITDLLGAINTRCGGAHPYTFVNTGGTLGTDAIRVQQIYRTGVVSPVGSPLVDLDPVHNRPPTAQTFDVVDATNSAFGQRFTVIANHFRAKSCGGATGGDADAGDGQSCYAATRVAQANRLLTWINNTVVPASGDPDVLLLGDFNAYAQEDSIATIEAGGYSDLETAFQGPAAYSYVFGGAVGHLDYAFASTSLTSQVVGAAAWHINADEVPLLDYNDEIADVGEAAFDEKPDGSALVPPRVVYQPATPYRAADHDPVLVGLFAISDLAVTVTDSPDPVTAGTDLAYTITIANNGPDVAAGASLSLTLPPGTTFGALPAVAGWSCTTPAVGSGGTITCTNAAFAVGSSVFTLTVGVDASVVAGTVLSATATASSTSGDPTPGNNSGTATTTVTGSADLGVTNTAAPATATSGQTLTYTITATNAGPSNAANVTLAHAIPADTTFASLSSPAGWSCTTPAVGAGGTVTCTNANLALTSAVFTLVVNVDAGATAANIVGTATVSSTTTDPASGNDSATATTPLSASADLGITNTAAPASAISGETIAYTLTVTNAGPSNAASVSLTDAIPANTTFASLTSPGGWSCTTPAVGATGNVACTAASVAPGSAVFTLVVTVDAAATAANIVNQATVSSTTTDPATGNESATATTPLGASANLGITNTPSTTSVFNGQPITYTLTVTNAGPSNAANVTLTNAIPANTTFTSLTVPGGGWNCTMPAVGGTGTVTCTNPNLAVASAVFSLVVTVDANAPVTMIVDTASVTSTTPDPTPGNESSTASTTTPVSLQSFEVD